ncbi:uncharacterized protein J3D65DRAFT_666443 [Phyllosticta citribraziliensis]|uniref:PWI domain-containing protein n=1 Tax=Phyllosticta citribraziliensis TaxID=989973 RepID=A0ABR1LX70_9PEZI
MYNYPAGQYGRPPGYASYPPAGSPPGMAPPPGMGAPPGMMPPGMSAPPGMQQSQSPLPARPGNLPPSFAPPAGMPNINFNAPVIRLGTTGPGAKDDRKGGSEPQSAGGRRPGLGGDYRGLDSQRQQRESIVLQPPTREEIARTIFVSSIPEAVTNDDLERILTCAGNLRRWDRPVNSENTFCNFGFAEYEDAESLETAAAILEDGVQVPAKKPEKIKAEDEELEMAHLAVKVDNASLKYAEEWKGKRDEDEAASQFRIDTAKEALTSVLESLKRPREAPIPDSDGDIKMVGSETKIDGATGEVVTIPLSVEDELSDIPLEMRETVAAEIAAFRERSVRKDLETLEEQERSERQRSTGNRINRLASPPVSAPSGPGGGANGIPLGPSKRGVEGAPSGPKGFGKEHNGITFVQAHDSCPYVNRSDEDDSASDEELERRRRRKKVDEEEKSYREAERRWLNRERQKGAAIARLKRLDEEEEARAGADKEDMRKRLAEWDDDVESSRRTEEYYADRSAWIRNRAAFRQREMAADDKDRQAEERELAREREQAEHTRGANESRARDEDSPKPAAITQPREPQRFKISLGAAASQRKEQAPRRTAAEVEGLLEDEEDAANANAAPRKLIPLSYDSSAADTAGMSAAEREAAARRLASEIPTDKEGIWSWKVLWDFLDDSAITEQIHPFLGKKVMEALGVQEDMVVEVIENHIRNKGDPQELVNSISEFLEDEAEPLVKKVYRMVIYLTESEKRNVAT